MKAKIKQKMIPPSLTWNEIQMDLYFKLLKRQDAIIAYYWTDNKNMPALGGSRDKKWKAESCLKQKAKKLPFSKRITLFNIACSRYGLHATFYPKSWENYGATKLWVVALCGKVFEDTDEKLVSQNRVIIGEVPKKEYNKRFDLLNFDYK